MMVNVEQIKGNIVEMAFASAPAVLSIYVVNLIFIQRLGYLAAAYTTFADFLFLLALHMCVVYKMRVSLVYSYRFIVSAVIVVGVVMLGMYVDVLFLS